MSGARADPCAVILARACSGLPADTAAARQHLAACPRCAAGLAALRDAVSELAAAERALADVPAVHGAVGAPAEHGADWDGESVPAVGHGGDWDGAIGLPAGHTGNWDGARRASVAVVPPAALDILSSTPTPESPAPPPIWRRAAGGARHLAGGLWFWPAAAPRPAIDGLGAQPLAHEPDAGRPATDHPSARRRSSVVGRPSPSSVPPAWAALPVPVHIQQVAAPALRALAGAAGDAPGAVAGEVTVLRLPDPQTGLDLRLMVAPGNDGSTARYTIALAGLAPPPAPSGAAGGSGAPPARPAPIPWRPRVLLRSAPERALLEGATADSAGGVVFRSVLPGDYQVVVEQGPRTWELALHLLAGGDAGDEREGPGRFPLPQGED